MEIIDTNFSYTNLVKRDINSINTIILHHTASTTATPEQIHQWHKSSGGVGFGYNFYVRKDGKIYRGRPLQYRGGHASGHNTYSIGVCFEGNFENETMGDTQKKSGQEIVQYLKDKYNIDRVIRHSDVNATACPGKNFPFDEINSKVDAPISDSNGEDAIDTIIEVQHWLNVTYGLHIAEDNLYGRETKGALVKALQTEINKQYARSLKVDGKFGVKTYSACPNVSINDRGNITRIVQCLLICKGYDLDADGIFGTITQSCVKDYQMKNRLVKDGICGKNTFKKLCK